MQPSEDDPQWSVVVPWPNKNEQPAKLVPTDYLEPLPKARLHLPLSAPQSPHARGCLTTVVPIRVRVRVGIGLGIRVSPKGWWGEVRLTMRLGVRLVVRMGLRVRVTVTVRMRVSENGYGARARV